MAKATRKEHEVKAFVDCVCASVNVSAKAWDSLQYGGTRDKKDEIHLAAIGVVSELFERFTGRKPSTNELRSMLPDWIQATK